jgi:hypothetical protein
LHRFAIRFNIEIFKSLLNKQKLHITPKSNKKAYGKNINLQYKMELNSQVCVKPSKDDIKSKNKSYLFPKYQTTNHDIKQYSLMSDCIIFYGYYISPSAIMNICPLKFS